MRRLFPLNVLFILLGGAVGSFWVYLTGGREFLSGLVQAPSGQILALPALTATWLFVRFLRWQFLLRRFGVRVPIRPSFAIYLASLPGTATPAYVGEMVRAVFMRREFGVAIPITIAVLFIERLFDIIALCVILAMTVNLLWVRLTMLLLLAALGLFILVADPFAVHLGTPTGVLKHRAHMIVFTEILALSIATWVPACLLVTLAAASLNLYVSPVMGMHAFSIATLLGAATLMPAGFGATGSLEILQLQGIGLSLADSVIVVSLVRLMSTDLALAVGTIFLLRQLTVTRRRGKESAAHFDAIAREYDEQFSGHIWNHLLERRIGLITSALPSPAPAAGVGLDMGCGLGRQCLEMGKRGYRVVGVDPAYKLIEQGAKAGATVVTGDALQLPFGDTSFDFVYVIGVFHHLPGVDAQRAAYREAARVLKPGGLLFVYETNPRNLLVRFYMSYIFPILKSIDEGTEWWIDPQRWEDTEGLKLCKLQYFTFLPDFLPFFLMRSAVTVESFLEKSLLRAYSVHYGAVLQKLSNPIMLAPFGTLKIDALQPLLVDHP